MTARGTLLGLLLAVATAPAAVAEDLAVIVHLDRRASLTVEELAQIYLKKRRFWDDGGLIVPVNRDSGSTARESFTRIVFGSSASRLSVYWNRQYFLGVLPPATLASDEAVKRFVASEPLAIGYVRSSTVDRSVRVLLDLHDREAASQPGGAPGF